MAATSNLRSTAAIDRFFRAESVVIVGASPKGGYLTSIVRNLKKWGYSGKLAVVNPRYEQVEGVPCFPSLAAIPYPIGLAVVGIRSDAVPAVLDDCEAANVGAVQIISSGFAEEGGEGVTRQRRLIEWAERTGIPVVGPNCLGLMSVPNRQVALAMACQPSSVKAGGVSLVLQSGTLATGLLMPLCARGIGIARLVTTGNEACVDVADFIRYLADDEDTRVIACYCEQFKRPLEFIKACERAADNNKPIVMIKVGRSDGARSAAFAHTGSLVGSDMAVDAVLKKLGVIRVDTADDLIETAAALSTTKRPRGRRVAFVSWSGTAGSMLSDLADACGIDFAPPPPAVKAQLSTIIPEYGTVSNPLDLTGQAFYDTRIIDESLKTLATCGAYDVVAYGGDFPSSFDMGSSAGQALTRAAAAAPDVVFPVMSLVGGHFYTMRDPQSAMADPQVDFDGMPLLQGAGTGLRALSALIDYAEFLRTRKPNRRLSDQRGQRSAYYAEAVRIIRQAKSDVLTEREGKRLLALYGIPVTREALATSPSEAARIAQDLTFPVAMKVESIEIVHKTDVGGVALNLCSSEEAAKAFEQIVASVHSHRPKAEIAGVVVQDMAKPGIELVLGATFDPQFGPVVAVGLGGIWVEALNDVRVLLPPFDAADVHAEIGQLRAASVLRGARGGAKADLEALADCIVKFGTLCTDLADEIGEIDINPIILVADGSGLTAVDCLITRKNAKGSTGPH
ncbi:acetate--CoA ligase family protein [Bradyrhizobium sp. Arg816]|uniref:acetate--CoA ligase family protein n=1 Tax=Bradyrhizobium sp. Arg816 TaxID=2998491 RepID=UPI00249EAE21|nr:acetate--CoA ligase family protein [Bradyrhizobium sp. Arg816]MDI3567441.1 acetate--CoA ligase family protein [Bradyrhizobium sp. Arg816]